MEEWGGGAHGEGAGPETRVALRPQEESWVEPWETGAGFPPRALGCPC